LLCVKNLKTYFYGEKGTVKAVDGVSFDVYKGEAVGLIGETGCGKTTVAFSILGLIPHLFETKSGFFRLVQRVTSKGEVVDGEILFKGKDLLNLPEDEMRQIRGREISIIFQNPVASMHPMRSLGIKLESQRKLMRE